MKREYRIIRDYRITKGESHYAQMRTKRKFLFWTRYSDWQRISKHVVGFGLYDFLDWPKSYEECAKIIESYDTWVNAEKQLKVVHSYQ